MVLLLVGLTYNHINPSAMNEKKNEKLIEKNKKCSHIVLFQNRTWEDPVNCLADLRARSGPLSGKVAWNISPVFMLYPVRQ
jgi:hypothetical protein